MYQLAALQVTQDVSQTGFVVVGNQLVTKGLIYLQPLLTYGDNTTTVRLRIGPKPAKLVSSIKEDAESGTAETGWDGEIADQPAPAGDSPPVSFNYLVSTPDMLKTIVSLLSDAQSITLIARPVTARM